MNTPDGQRYFTTDRPVAVLMVFVALVVFGYFSLGQLPVTLMPDMSYPTLTVRTEYPGAAPEEVENDISRGIEEQLGVISGLSEISSISRAGISDVILEFSWGSSMSDAIQNTLEKLDTVRLPRGAEKPLLLHYDPSLDPVMELSLSFGEASDVSSSEVDPSTRESDARRLRRLAELQIKRSLEPVKGVAAVRVRGGLEEEIHVLVDATELQRSNLSMNQVVSRLSAENINAAGGRIREGEAEYMVRTINEYQNLDEIANTVISRRDGKEIRLKDMARVTYGQKDQEMLTRTDGLESVQIDIFKEADSNMVQVARRVKQALGSAEGGENAGLAGRLWKNEQVLLKMVADRSLFIQGSIQEVKSTAIVGGALAILVLFLFLRDLRTTLIIALSIPISVAVTFAPLNVFEVSLNIMSLGGLAMGIGMLVDSSIVVLESIYRCRQEGDDVRMAAVRGTREVRGAVIASTLTSICVFFPMVFVEGMAGQVFGDLGLTVVTSLLVSLLVAVLFIPMLASRHRTQQTQGIDAGCHPLLRSGPSLNPRSLMMHWLLPILLLLLAMEAVVIAWGVWHGWDTESELLMASIWETIRLPCLRVGFVWGVISLIPMGMGMVHTRASFSSEDSLGPELLWQGWPPSPATGRHPWFLLRVLTVLYQWPRMAVSMLLQLIGFNLVFAIQGGALFFSHVTSRMAAIGRLYRPSTPRWFSGFNAHAYRALLSRCLRYPKTVFALALCCMGMTWVLAQQLESELLPEVRQNEFTMEVALPVGTPLEETVGLLQAIERSLLEQKEALEIETLLVMYGFDTANMKSADEGEHSAKFKVLLQPVEDPQVAETRAIGTMRRLLEQIPDADYRVTRPVLFSSKKPVVVQINGEELHELKRLSDQSVTLLRTSDQLSDVEPTLKRGAPELQISYDRLQMIRHGLTIGSVANQVRDLVRGAEATRLNRKDKRVPIVVRLATEDRETLEDVGHLIVNPGSSNALPLNAVASLSVGEGPSEIRRIDGNRVALVQSNIGGRSLGAAVNEVDRILKDRIEWPDSLSYLITGQNQEWQRSRSSLYLALGLSVFLVYVIMASQFESLWQPFIIMVTIPLAFVGSVLGLHWMGMNVSVVVFLGLIMLAGIVVNNAIVLVDYTNTLRGRGVDLKEAVLEACRVRLRPILMTTATTVLGLFPLALGLGDGAEIRAPMAVTVIGGLLSSTLLTLLTIPTLYYLLARLGERFFGPVSSEVSA